MVRIAKKAKLSYTAYVLIMGNYRKAPTSISKPFCCLELSTTLYEKLNEAVMVMNKSLQEVNIQNMNVELVAQMFKNYQSNVLFHLEATENLKEPS
ncbi:DASH complex subunit Dad4-domain-containing protein [Aspergillus varians]